jgi:nitrate reductase (NAD(P)H)
MLAAGDDASEDFIAIHSSDAKRQVAQFHIGTLVGGMKTNESKSMIPSCEHDTGTFLLPNKWKKVRLRSVTDVSSDSKLFRFEFERPDQEFGLPVGQHVYVRMKKKIVPDLKTAESEMEIVQRAYTPISRWRDKGSVEFLIKYVFACQIP